MGNKPFQYTKLTEEEQKKRGILGRLVGVIADTVNPTRNNRNYSEKLWENVFNDPIMKEKIANKCCFGELNHPADRTDTDMEKVAICLAEQPKLGKDGKLYGVFDILNTPCGKILKALCDYGCKIGISSRGQGDLIDGINGDDVDPDTYECECFDAVLVPGVEAARLNYVTESLHQKNQKTINKIINESFRSAKDDEEMRIMKEQFKNLKLIEEDEKPDTSDAKIDDDSEIKVEEDPSEEEAIEIVDNEEAESDDDEDKKEEEINKEEIFLDYLSSNFNEDQIKKACEILNITVEEPDAEKEESESDETTTEEVAEEETSSDDINAEETEKQETDEAKDNGSKMMLNSLKEALKTKGELEAQMRELQEKLAASDTRVNDITETCNRYKSAITRLSAAVKANKANTEISKLQEALVEKDNTIEAQKTRIARLVKSRKNDLNNSTTVSESLSKKDTQIAQLNENLNADKKKYQEKLNSLTEKLNASIEDSNAQIKSLNEKLAKANATSTNYKNLANKTINKYIDVKADMLGLTARDIKRKLGESYTLEDVDEVCEDLKSYQLNVSKLPFGIDKGMGIKGIRVNESAAVKANRDIDDDDDTLVYKIAGLNE